MPTDLNTKTDLEVLLNWFYVWKLCMTVWTRVPDITDMCKNGMVAVTIVTANQLPFIELLTIKAGSGINIVIISWVI